MRPNKNAPGAVLKWALIVGVLLYGILSLLVWPFRRAARLLPGRRQRLLDEASARYRKAIPGAKELLQVLGDGNPDLAAKLEAKVGELVPMHSRHRLKRALLMLLTCATAVSLWSCAARTTDELPLESYSDSIGYRTVPEAQAALTAMANVTRSIDSDGWLHLRERRSSTAFSDWFFAPVGDPVYPTVILMSQDTSRSHSLRRMIRCESRPEQCEQLVEQRRRQMQRSLDEI